MGRAGRRRVAHRRVDHDHHRSAGPPDRAAANRARRPRAPSPDLTGELKVSIPLLGRKLEESSAPAVLAGFRTQQQVGDRWLDGRTAS